MVLLTYLLPLALLIAISIVISFYGRGCWSASLEAPSEGLIQMRNTIPASWEVTDLWNNGDIFNLTLNNEVHVNTTAKTVNRICSLIKSLTNSSAVPFCHSLYNGTNVCGGMGETQIKFINTTSEPEAVPLSM